MEIIFDLIVIGTGAGAMTAARKCKAAGWRVAVIDERPFGGTCALRGCDMKKVLMGAAELVDFNDRMKGKGIDAKVSVNWPELMAFKRSFIENYSKNMEKELDESGIAAFHGTARFVSEGEIQVGDSRLQGGYILIAAGARPMTLGLEGEEHVSHSDDFLDLDALPRSIVFLGGGMISFELAHIAARAGAAVTILERDSLPLSGFDADLAQLLLQKTEEIGVRFTNNTVAESVEKKADKVIIKAKKDGRSIEFECGLAVHGAGRVPNIDQLDLAAGNVAFGKRGVTVNEYLQSVSNPKAYAAGDAADTKGLPLTPVAGMDSRTVAENLLNGNHKVSDYSVIPSVLFTVPKIASVGLSEQQAHAQGYDYLANQMDMSGWYTCKRTNEKHAMAKVVIDKSTKHIIGAHFICNEADELVNHFAAAIRLKLTLTEFKSIMYAYPSVASDIIFML